MALENHSAIALKIRQAVGNFSGIPAYLELIWTFFFFLENTFAFFFSEIPLAISDFLDFFKIHLRTYLTISMKYPSIFSVGVSQAVVRKVRRVRI